jgi:L-cysteine:1D-myo-inositol 2-amino-2-deoxy-alpha-D-glucopyranoside ligase
MVGWQGHKMSKSRGNLVFVSGLRRDDHDPMAIRLALLAHHYRTDWAWTPHGLQGAQDRLELWRRGVAREAGPSWEPVLQRVREVLSDDLRTPSALDAIDHWAMAATAGEGSDDRSPRVIADAVDALLGVRL